jgi:oligoendopeptidase F
MARWKEAAAWFNPELLAIPLETVRGWMAADPDLALYRFAIEDLYRQQAHVLDAAGEHLLSLSSRLAGAPTDAYWSLSTADAKFPTVTLSDGRQTTVTYGQYRAILATNRRQADRALAYRVFHEMYAGQANTYASLYQAVCERDWFQARARRYDTTLHAALDAHNVPPAVVENLIETTRNGVEPLRRYHRLRRRALGIDRYHVYDTQVALGESDRRFAYDAVGDWIVESAAPLGDGYQRRVRDALAGGWIDVYENEGKRSGAYSAPVYGVHPYMLLNYNDTLDAVFTLAHEMGHSIHTMLSHEHQPFVYSSYTIFVAEVPSTLAEAMLLEYLLARATDRAERIALLQHAIDSITSTFYTQVLFADFELQAHRLVEAGRPVTAEALSDLYTRLVAQYYGDALDPEPLGRVTWARIPHFYSSPYYVYQYATCFASAAKLAAELTGGSEASRAAARERFLTLLASGGNDHPMEQLGRANVNLSEPDTVRAVATQLDDLVSRLERELAG